MRAYSKTQTILMLVLVLVSTSTVSMADPMKIEPIVTIGSLHIGQTTWYPDGTKRLNGFNPGIGARIDDTISFGCYYNSYRSTSCAVSVEKAFLRTDLGKAGVRVGGAKYGHKVVPMISLFHETDNGWRLDLVLDAREKVDTHWKITTYANGNPPDEKITGVDRYWESGVILSLSKVFK